MHAPKLERATSSLAREDDDLAVRREYRIDILSRVVTCQLAQKFSVFAIKIDVRMAGSFRLQISDRDRDLGCSAQIDREK
jgi:hypothetical protein